MRQIEKAFPKASAVVVLLAFVLGVLSIPAATAEQTISQPNWFQWNRTTLDVLIFPPPHGRVLPGLIPSTDPDEYTPNDNSYTATIEKGIQDWRNAIQQFGPTWLSQGVHINSYVMGRDTPPQNALLQPDVVFTAYEEEPVAWNGVAVSPNPQPCTISITKFRGVFSATVPEFHRTATHEFGHCLGLDHTTYLPDTMCSGCRKTNPPPGDPNGFYKCPSNLNILGVQSTFAKVLGQAGGGATASVLQSQYQQTTCGVPV